MRVLLTLILATVPAMAVADPQLKCGFDGNKTVVTIVNDGKDRQCNYACHFRLEGGSASVSGSIGVKAGETKLVDEETRRSKVLEVRESSLQCE